MKKVYVVNKLSIYGGDVREGEYADGIEHGLVPKKVFVDKDEAKKFIDEDILKLKQEFTENAKLFLYYEKEEENYSFDVSTYSDGDEVVFEINYFDELSRRHDYKIEEIEVE